MKRVLLMLGRSPKQDIANTNTPLGSRKPTQEETAKLFEQDMKQH
ncbi:hypothetical protein ACJ5NV_02350 [Loktanella agnita]